MTERDWQYISDTDTDSKHIYRFKHLPTERIEEVVLTKKAST